MAGDLQLDGDALLAAVQPLAQAASLLDTAAGSVVLACTAAQPADVGAATDLFTGAWGPLLQQLGQLGDSLSNGVVQAVLVIAQTDGALGASAQTAGH